MKNSITRKLILINFSLLASILIGFMIFQSFFFQSFYLKKKSEDLQKALLQFKTSYDYSWAGNPKALLTAMTSFEINNTARIAICPIDSNIKKITIGQGTSDEVDTTLNTILNSLKQEKFYTKEFLDSNKIITEVISTKHTEKQIVSMAPFSLNGKNDAVIVAISPFRTIEEASAIINDFYKAVILILIVLCFFLSYLFSNLISKPLLRLNKAAKKMSDMDFSEKCPIESNDEIGNLAKSLNFLSSNLSTALEDLKLKNSYLEKEIEKEREIEKLRKDFIASVSHELKTPIGIISGYAEGIKDGVVDSENTEVYLDVIIDEANKMNKMVLDMLNLSKLESKKVQLNLSNFSLKELTKEILEKFKNNINNNSLSVSFEDLTEDTLVYGDSFKIEQVISNFLTNAIKYTPKNQSINIKIKNFKNKIYFFIENTGTTIDEKDLDKIWTQFYRIDSSRNRDLGSYGLGLSICQNLLNLHNSDFGAHNTENGVEFFFSLEESIK
ncbi:MAG: HAMP domain-containing sensor histidine kinase [Sarcina sp.]